MEDTIQSSAVEFVRVAGAFIKGLELETAPKTLLARYISHFGISPRHTAYLWYACDHRLRESNPYYRRKHLLWTLNLLKSDDTEHVLTGRWGADENTIRKYLYITLGVLSRLGVVSTKYSQKRS